MDSQPLVYESDLYRLTFLQDRPYVVLERRGAGVIAELLAPGSVHRTDGRDDTVTLGGWERSEGDGETVFRCEAGSSVWDRKTVVFRCRRADLSHEISVEGTGSIDEVCYFGGYCSAVTRWGTGFFSSGGDFTRGFNPEPNVYERYHFDPGESSSIDLTGGPLPGRRHWFFTPAPFCLGLETRSGWLALGIEAEPECNTFHEYRYVGGDGFHLSLRFDGGARVHGSYRLPAVRIAFAADEDDVLAGYVRGLRSAGLVAPGVKRAADWWHRPMFCGWGAQCHRAAADAGSAPASPDLVDIPAFLAAMRNAPSYSRQAEYDAFLEALQSERLTPGTVVLDDKWQQTYGGNVADVEKWPDLRGFIARRHASGQHVLLWLKAWDCEGVPEEECIRNAAGAPLAVDPTHPDFERRLRASVRQMIGRDGYDADGFKIDFTHRIPVGPGLQSHHPVRGLELLRLYLGIIRDEAKRAKADALIVAHTPNPYLADMVDMIRLNDMLDLTRFQDPAAGRHVAATVRTRAAIASAACPEALIDTDNWPVRDRAAWREYIRMQPTVGVPSLYFATHIDLTGEPLEADDYALLREVWTCPR